MIHIDGDTLNSHVNNIRWGTKEEKVLIDKSSYRLESYINNVTLPGEEWKDCSLSGFPDYLASSLGRIYSMRTGKVLSGYVRADGYCQVNIPNGDKNKCVLAHTLICNAFHGNPPDVTHTVDHIDRNKVNNIPSNLRWASKSEQTNNRVFSSNKPRRIAQIENAKIIDFHDEQAVMEIFDVDILRIPNNGIQYNGYLWMYEKFIKFNIKGEKWMPLNINNKLIKVSNMGRIETNDDKDQKRRKRFGGNHASGYKSVDISGKKYLVHTLVVIAFRGNYSPDLVVNHIDRDKTNNRLDNLEVVTKSENTIHAINSGTKSTKQVTQISPNGEIIATFSSIQKASDATGIYHSSIGKAANGKQKTAGGFIWKFT